MKHTSSMFPLISSVLPAKKRNIAPWIKEKNTNSKLWFHPLVSSDEDLTHSRLWCNSIYCSRSTVWQLLLWCLTKTFPLWIGTQFVRALSLFSGMGRHVGKRWSRKRDCEFTRMWVRRSGRNDNGWTSALQTKVRWCRDSVSRGDWVRGRWNKSDGANEGGDKRASGQ